MGKPPADRGIPIVKITLISDEALQLEGESGPLTIEAESPAQEYSPFHMLGSALATCVHGVLTSWARQAALDAVGISIAVSWTFVEEPHRVGRLALGIRWPGLPPARLEAARRAASLCAIHATLTHPPQITVEGA